jgi:sporulation protein YlmC with PRC-barrel domain
LIVVQCRESVSGRRLPMSRAEELVVIEDYADNGALVGYAVMNKWNGERIGIVEDPQSIAEDKARIKELEAEHGRNCMCANCKKHKATLADTMIETSQVISKLEAEIEERERNFKSLKKALSFVLKRIKD